MIDRLQEILPHLAHLPLEAQEEAAIYIEALLEALESEAFAPGRARSILREGESIAQWEDPAGAWSNLPDTLLDDLDQLRHASPPTL